MAARRRLPDDADPSGQGVLPVELADHASAVWRDGRLFRQWCERNLPAGAAPDRSQDVPDPGMPAVSWVARFTMGRDRWAFYHGVVRDGRTHYVDRAGMISMRPSSGERPAWDFTGEVDMPHRRIRRSSAGAEDELVRIGCARVRAIDRAAARHGQDLPVLLAERAAVAAREAAETGQTGPAPAR